MISQKKKKFNLLKTLTPSLARGVGSEDIGPIPSTNPCCTTKRTRNEGREML